MMAPQQANQKRRVGGQPGNQNGRKSGLYSILRNANLGPGCYYAVKQARGLSGVFEKEVERRKGKLSPRDAKTCSAVARIEALYHANAKILRDQKLSPMERFQIYVHMAELVKSQERLLDKLGLDDQKGGGSLPGLAGRLYGPREARCEARCEPAAAAESEPGRDADNAGESTPARPEVDQGEET